MDHNGPDMLADRRREFHWMLKAVSQNYRGGWLIAFKSKAPKQGRLSDYVITEDPNDIVQKIPGCIFGAFGQAKGGVEF